ncbi:MAG: polysaccharide deacetylase family protein [Clostridia bacterium]|nr:polysaccharide deacetylase family protein [Clostridia bacterium]
MRKHSVKVLALILCLYLLLLSGCAPVQNLLHLETPTPSPTPTPEPTPTPTIRPSVTPVPTTALTSDPAPVLTGVETDQDVISLVFEGFTDEASMEELLKTLQELKVAAVFFITGKVADECPELVKKIRMAGCEVGNYGLTGAKKMENNGVDENIYAFRKTQELIYRAIGQTPRYVRMNGSEYTETLLRAVSTAGLEAAVMPTLYLNHKSFSSSDDAEAYARNLIRGSIVSVKLGQELDLSEFIGSGPALDEKPAIDPSPSIGEVGDNRRVEVDTLPLDQMRWLIAALKKLNYKIVMPDELARYAVTLLPEKRELTEEETTRFDADLYPWPVTEEPVNVGRTRQGKNTDFNDVVFVGASDVASLESYVEWKRETDPEYLGNARFLYASRLTIEQAVNHDPEGTNLPAVDGEKMAVEDALAKLGAKTAYLMLRFESRQAYLDDQFFSNLKLLIYRIRQKNPGIRLVLQGSFPAVAGKNNTPSNTQLFRFNLKLAALCARTGLTYLDPAFALRTEEGALRDDYCLDRMSYGTHLNDAGCQAWIDFLMQNVPE